jgi:hypothetical protein
VGEIATFQSTSDWVIRFPVDILAARLKDAGKICLWQ